MSKIPETHKALELVVPRRIECEQDITDAIEEFEQKLNVYIQTHAIRQMVDRVNGSHGWRVMSRNHVDIVREDDKRRLAVLFPNDERISSSIPMGALLNRYEQFADKVRDLLARKGDLHDWEFRHIREHYLGEKPSKEQ